MQKNYLKVSIKAGLLLIIGFGLFRGYRFYKEILEKERRQKEKNRAILQLFSKWMQKKETGKTIESYLKEMNFQTVAIYGMSDAGQRLYDELKHTEIEVKYAIDKRAVELENELPVMSVNDELDKVDVIIVTAIYDFFEIADFMKQKSNNPVISLEQIVYEM
ncbi:MAG: hypothetical protein K2P50_11450 [Lachnospiraceae bacterium]|nr:hypothetical protein [Lachnospiraceae bacterium]